MSEETKSVKSKTAEAAEGAPPPKPAEEEAKHVEDEGEGGWRRFLWNEDTREFLGRTGKSWLLIGVFYVIFFASVAAFFLLNWFIVLSFVKPDEPSQIHWPVGNSDVPGHRGILGGLGPGLTMRPRPDIDNNMESTLIWFSVGAYDGYKFWSEQLVKWVRNIPKKVGSGVVDCGVKTNVGAAGKSNGCLLDTQQFGPCSGDDNTFGYGRGEPCILIKLNRIYGWEPKKCGASCQKNLPGELKSMVGTYNPSSKTWDLQEDRIYVWCEGREDHDKENMGSIEYFPGPYIESKYFPFTNQVGYQTPFLMLQLKRPTVGAMISIKCKAYAGNLQPNKDDSVGYLEFQVMIG